MPFKISNKAETLPVESQFNITTVAISPDGWLLLLVNEEGECHLCNTRSKSIIHRFNFARKIHAIKFSPDGTYALFSSLIFLFII